MQPLYGQVPHAHLGDYCDVYLTHDSMSVRKAHNAGRNHLRNVVEYYQRTALFLCWPAATVSWRGLTYMTLQKSAMRKPNLSSTPSHHPTPPKAKLGQIQCCNNRLDLEELFHHHRSGFQVITLSLFSRVKTRLTSFNASRSTRRHASSPIRSTRRARRSSWRNDAS